MGITLKKDKRNAILEFGIGLDLDVPDRPCRPCPEGIFFYVVTIVNFLWQGQGHRKDKTRTSMYLSTKPKRRPGRGLHIPFGVIRTQKRSWTKKSKRSHRNRSPKKRQWVFSRPQMTNQTQKGR